MWELFKGQEQLVKELKNLVNYPVSLLIRGPSGYGKTLLARIFCSEVGKYQEFLGSFADSDEFYLDHRADIFFVDEAHECKNSELFYPLIDKKLRFVFCTNEAANIKEPLRNRCIERILKAYSREELIDIVSSKNEVLSQELIELAVDNSRDVPRLALQMGFLFMANDIKTSRQGKEYLESVGIINGFSEADRKYLEYLTTYGKASINTLATYLSMYPDQVRSDVEPYLIRKGLIKISSRGRELCK